MFARARPLVGLRSRKHISTFDLERPLNPAEVHSLMARPGRSVLMAGGLDLIDRMKSGETTDRVIFLGGIGALKTIERDDRTVNIGALATHADVERSGVLAEMLPDLPSLWLAIGNPRVRYAGTIGGNLISGLPHYDAAPALLALGARATVSFANHDSTVGISELAKQRHGLLERISIDDAPSFRLIADRSLHPILSLYLAGRFDNAGNLQHARLAIGCAFAQPLACDLPAAEFHAPGSADIAHAIATSLPDPVDDGLASSQYRRRMIEVLLRRLIVRLGARS